MVGGGCWGGVGVGGVVASLGPVSYRGQSRPALGRGAALHRIHGAPASRSNKRCADRHDSALGPACSPRDAPPARCCAMFTELSVACAPCAAAPDRPPRSAATGRVQGRRGRGARGPRRRPAACADTCAGCVVPASRLRCTYRGRRAACPCCAHCAPSSLAKCRFVPRGRTTTAPCCHRPERTAQRLGRL